MTGFASMLDAFAHAVRTLADGGGPFWDVKAEQSPSPIQMEALAATNRPQRKSDVLRLVAPVMSSILTGCGEHA